jgi:hypothetical protein
MTMSSGLDSPEKMQEVVSATVLEQVAESQQQLRVLLVVPQQGQTGPEKERAERREALLTGVVSRLTYCEVPQGQKLAGGRPSCCCLAG